jgi:hypothetical protein
MASAEAATSEERQHDTLTPEDLQAEWHPAPPQTSLAN